MTVRNNAKNKKKQVISDEVENKLLLDIDTELDQKEDLDAKQYKLVEKGKKGAEIIKKRYDKAKQAVPDRDGELRKNMAVYEGKVYKLPEFSSNKPWAVRMKTPYAKVAVDTRTSSAIASDYRGDLIPFRVEDIEVVEALQNILNNEWDRMKLDKLIKRCVKSSAIVREAYLHFEWKKIERNVDAEGKLIATKETNRFGDNRNGYVKATKIMNPSSVLIDPEADSITEAQYVHITSTLSPLEVKELYPDWFDIVEAGQGGYDPESMSTSEGSVSDRDKKENYTIITHYEKSKGHVNRFIVIEDVLVEEQEFEFLTRIPVAQMRWQEEHMSPYGLSLMDDLVDLQIAINAIESSLTQVAVAYSAPSYFLSRGSGINAKRFAQLSGAPGFVAMVNGNPNEVAAPIKVPKLDQAVVNAKGEYISAMNVVAGITNQYLGSIGTAGNTAQGTEMAIERAKIIEAEVVENIEDFVEQITRIIVEYMSVQYSGTNITTRKISLESGKPTFEEVALPQKIEDIMYSFNIKLDSRTKYAQAQELQIIQQLYQEQIQYKDSVKVINQGDIIRLANLTNKEELLERYQLAMDEMLSQKAQIILEITKEIERLDVDGTMAQYAEQAYVEILSDAEEKPYYEQLMQMLRQAAEEFDQMKEADMQEISASQQRELDADGVYQQENLAAEQEAAQMLEGMPM